MRKPMTRMGRIWPRRETQKELLVEVRNAPLFSSIALLLSSNSVRMTKLTRFVLPCSTLRYRPVTSRSG